MASVTIQIPNSGWQNSSSSIFWRTGSNISMGNDLSVGGTTELFFGSMELRKSSSGSAGDVNVQLSDSASGNEGAAGPDFSDQMEMAGTITLTALDGSSVVIPMGGGDTDEPYNWTPSNASDVATFADTLGGLTNRSLTVTFDDNALPDASAPTSVVIVGGNSVDSEGTLSLGTTVSGGTYDALAYAWDDGGAGGSFSTQTAATIYTAPAATSDTAVTLTCTVTATGDGTNAADGTTDEATGTKNITVNAADLMPTAPSVDDQAGFVGQVASTITLPEGTGGDGTLTYALSGLPGGLSFSASNRQITGTPTTAGEYIVTYTVDDADNDSDSSQFTYRIAGYDQSGRDVVVYAQIIAAAGADPYPAVNPETVGTVDLVVDDVDITINRIRNSSGGADVRIRRSGAGSWQTEFEDTGGAYNTGGWQVILALASGNITMDVPGDVNSGTNALNLRMDVPSGDQADFGALGAGHPFILVISRTAVVDVAPSFTDSTGDDQDWVQGTAITSITVPTASGTPTPTYAVEGSLPAGIAFNTTTRVISGTPTAVGSGTITIRASNSEGNADWTVDYATTAALAAPSFADDTGDDQSWTVNAAITDITVPAADGNPTPTYAVQGSLPAGISFNTTTRVISGTPTAAGSGTITIRASNSEGNDDWTVDYTTSTQTIAPNFADDTGDAQSWTQNTAITRITVPAATGTPTPSYAVQGSLPAGIQFNTSNRRITGTPTAVGSGTIRIRATNTAGTDDWTVTYTTTAADLMPTLPNVADQSATQNTSFTVTLPQATGGDVPLTYSLTGTLPSGLSFVASTRVLSGTPTNTGTFSLTYTVTDDDGDSDSDDFDLVVSAQDLMPTLPNVTRQDAVQGTAFAVTLPEATGGDTPLTYSLTGTLPTGVTFTPATRALAGTPTQTGTFALTYRVEDADGDADTDNFNLRVAVPADLMPSLPGIASQSATEDAAYSFTLPAATSGDLPLTYSLSGTLPAGITFAASTRLLAGTPTELGSFDLTYEVEDDDGDTDTADFTLSVRAVGAGEYSILVDTDGDGSFATDIFADVISYNHSTGVFGVRREGISAGAGTLTVRLYNNEQQHDVNDFKEKDIRVEYNGAIRWGGRIDEPKEKPYPSDIRIITINALGILAGIGGNVATAINLPGDTLATEAIFEVTGITITPASTEVVTDLDIEAGAKIHDALRAIQNSSGTRLYEKPNGTLGLASQGITETRDDAPLFRADTLSFVENDPARTIINAVIIDGQKYSNGDSVGDHGEILHQGDFAFTKPSEAVEIAANILALYAQPQGIFKLNFLLEHLAGDDTSGQNAILNDLHYGNEALLTLQDGDTQRLVEILNVSHRYDLTYLHMVTLTLRERDVVSLLGLTFDTVINTYLTYSVNLPDFAADGTTAITGHLVEYKLPTETAWTRGTVQSGTGMQTDEIELPTEELYDIRVVARSASSDEQVGISRCVMVANVRIVYDPNSATQRFDIRRVNTDLPQVLWATVVGWQVEAETLYGEFGGGADRIRERHYVFSPNVTSPNYNAFLNSLTAATRIELGLFNAGQDGVAAWRIRSMRFKLSMVGYITYWSPEMTPADLQTYAHN